MSMKVPSKWSFYITNIQEPYKNKEMVLNSKYIHEFFFIENIENMFLTAELAIDDKYGFFEIISLSGKEGIKVIIEQELEELEMIKTFEFEIYNITIEIPTISQNIHRFYLVEKGAFNFFGSNYCVGFNDKKISDIIKSILDNQLKIKSSDYEIEETFDKLSNYVIPYVKPSESIKGLIKKARRNTSPHDGGYLFYSTSGDENRKIPMKKFVSFSNLIKKDVPKSTGNADYNIYSFRKQEGNQYFINVFKEVENLNYAKQSIKSNGIGGKHYFGINYNVDKNILDVNQKYSEFINKVPLLGKTAYFDKSIDNINDEIGFFGGEKETIQAREDFSLRMLIEGYNRREVILEGALFRYAGQKIFVEQMALNDSDIHNIQDYGYWIIKGITHYYALGAYTQKVTIIKDSYAESEVTKGKIIA
jgi:hypothetical protein